jgi:hypothetical protein
MKTAECESWEDIDSPLSVSRRRARIGSAMDGKWDAREQWQLSLTGVEPAVVPADLLVGFTARALLCGGDRRAKLSALKLSTACTASHLRCLPGSRRLRAPGERMALAQVEASGARVLFGVDAGALLASLKLAKKYKQGGDAGLNFEDRFDRVVFNFPHAGLGIKDQDVNVTKNQELLQKFFLNANEVVRVGGQVHVALKRGKPYDLWNTQGLAHRTSGYAEAAQRAVALPASPRPAELRECTAGEPTQVEAGAAHGAQVPRGGVPGVQSSTHTGLQTGVVARKQRGDRRYGAYVCLREDPLVVAIHSWGLLMGLQCECTASYRVFV